MNGKLAIVLGFLLAAGAIFYFTAGRQPAPPPGQPQASSGPAQPRANPNAVEITFLYSTEKKDWVEAATAAFAREHPEISVKLVGKGSLDAAQALVDQKERPTLWSPADSLVLGLAASDWLTRNGAPLVAAEGTEDAPAALVITPLVFVAWEDRGSALSAKTGGKVSWHTLHDAVASNQGWPAVGGKAEWGFVKLGQTDPTRSNSGMQALASMTYEYFEHTSGLKVGDVLDPRYQEWVRDIEKGVTRFETSTGTFMTDMVRFGPSKYDVAVVYENLAASQLENAQGRWGNLRVYYPASTLWSDHPVAVLQAPWVTDAQRKAARTYVAYLRSKPVQEQALNFGFRPADPAVAIKGAANSPFTRLSQYGIQVDIPPAAEAPSPEVVRNLLTMWSRVVGSH